MNLPIWFRRAFPALVAFAACLPAGSAAAAPVARSSVVVSGRVLDEAGAPVPQTWILVRGSRRLSALTDSTGAYRITVPGGTVEELAKSPVSIRVQARRKGMSLATRDGATELGIEMRVRRDTTSIWRFQVRSNRPPVAALIAGAAMVDPNPRVEVSVDFRASRGTQVENLPVPLPAIQEIALVGPPPQGVEFARAPRGAELRGTEVSVMPDGPLTPATSRAGEVKSSAATEEERAAREAKKRERDEAKKRQRLEREEKSRLAKAERAAADSAATLLAADPAAKKSRGRGGRHSIFADSREAPDTGDLATRPSQLTRIEPEIVLSRGPARSERSANPPGGAAQTSSCRVRGTLEVEADRPLAESMKVDVFIDGMPGHTDTVELFMGSPRTFDLGWVPCGPQAVGFTTHSRQRFRLRTLSPITCRPGEIQHVRLVLEPSRGRTAMR